MSDGQCGGCGERTGGICGYCPITLVSSFRGTPPPSPLRARWAGLIAALVLSVLTGCGGGQASDASPVPSPDPNLSGGVVRVQAGSVRGQVAPDHVLFQGIPYAAPAEGELRWQPPAPVPPWQGVRDATKVGARCIQDSARDPDYGRGMSEDCLSVNVWSPTDAAGLPVMVWIHGGAFVNGSADVYDARWLATRGRMVVVTVNYRLGALGFLAHPDLGPADQLGNYGLADQQAALRWVRDNIGAFGGDPAKVTVAGESAGGMSVCDHLAAPASDGLFRAAIVMSGPCQAQLDVAAARAPSLEYAADVGCPDPATAAHCLRALPATALTEPVYYGHLGYDGLSGPVSGTSLLPVDPVRAFETDSPAARVPLLIGTTRDEFTLFMALEYLRLGHEPAPADYPALLEKTFGRDGPAVGERYPLNTYGGNVSAAYSAAVTDGAFACVADRIGDDLAGDVPVYAYEFNDRTAPTPEPLRTVPFPVGAGHSLELRYLFDIGGTPALDPVQQRLSDQMIDYFSRFVATGVPAAPDAPDWPVLDGDARDDGPRMAFDADGSRVATGFEQEHQCGFWDSLER